MIDIHAHTRNTIFIKKSNTLFKIFSPSFTKSRGILIPLPVPLYADFITEHRPSLLSHLCRFS